MHFITIKCNDGGVARIFARTISQIQQPPLLSPPPHPPPPPLRPLHESPLTTDQAEAIRSYNQVTIQHTLLCGNRNRVWNRNSVFFFNYLKYISGAPWLEGNCAYSNYLLLISLLLFSFFLFLFFFGSLNFFLQEPTCVKKTVINMLICTS